MPRHRKGDVPIPGYMLDELLGSGGTKCQVWSAHGNAGNPVAIKFLPLVEGKQDLAKREARTLIRNLKFISHPFLLPIHRVELFDAVGNQVDLEELASDGHSQSSGADDGGRGTVVVPRVRGIYEMVIVMGLADESLADKLDDCHRIPHDELLRYMEDAAHALDYLNRRDDARQKPAIQHGDIKPQNIMLLAGRVQICDYGLARALLEGDVRQTTSVAGHSPAYAAPEVIKTRFAGPRSDQFSLAVTYIELRTGRLPFPDHFTERRQFEEAILEGKLDLSELVDPAERQVIARATSVNPDDRFATVKEMVDKLRAAGTQPLPPPARLTDDESPEDEAFDVSQSFAKATIPDRLGKDDVVLGYRLEDLVFEEGSVTAWLSKAVKGKSSRLIYVRELADGAVDTKALKLFETDLVHDHLWRPDQVCLVDSVGHLAQIDAGGQVALPTGSARAGQRWSKAIVIGPKSRRSLHTDLYENSFVGLDAHELLPLVRKLADVLDLLNDPQHRLRHRRFAVVHGNVQPAHCLKRWDKQTQNYTVVQLGNPLWARVLEKDELDLGGSGLPGGQFCAPEVTQGRLTRWSDQYSLAASYVRLRTGHWPFDPAASTERVDEARRRGELDLTGLFEAEKGVIGTAMAYEPRERYASCVALVEALQKAVHSREFDQTVPVLPSGQVDTDDDSLRDEPDSEVPHSHVKRDTDQEQKTNHPTESETPTPKLDAIPDADVVSPSWPPRGSTPARKPVPISDDGAGTLVAVDKAPCRVAQSEELRVEPAERSQREELPFRIPTRKPKPPKRRRRVAAVAVLLLTLTGGATLYAWWAGGNLAGKHNDIGKTTKPPPPPKTSFEQALADCRSAIASGDTLSAIAENGQAGKIATSPSDSEALQELALELVEHCEKTNTPSSKPELTANVKNFYLDVRSRGFIDQGRLDELLAKLDRPPSSPSNEFQKHLTEARRFLLAKRLASAETACKDADELRGSASDRGQAELDLVWAQVEARKAELIAKAQAWDDVERRLAKVGVHFLLERDQAIFWALKVVGTLALAEREARSKEVVTALDQLSLPDEVALKAWPSLDRGEGGEFRQLHHSFSHWIEREFARAASEANQTTEQLEWLVKLRSFLPQIPDNPLLADLDAAQALGDIAKRFADSGTDSVPASEVPRTDVTASGDDAEELEQVVQNGLQGPLERMSAANVVPCCTVLVNLALCSSRKGAPEAALATLSRDSATWDRIGVDGSDRIDALRSKLEKRTTEDAFERLRRVALAGPIGPQAVPAENLNDPAWLHALRAETIVDVTGVSPDAWKKASADVGKAREALKRKDVASTEEKPFVDYVYALCAWRRPDGAKYEKAALDEVLTAFEAGGRLSSPFLTNAHRRQRACELMVDAADHHRHQFDSDDEKLKRLAPPLDVDTARRVSGWLDLPARCLDEAPELLDRAWLRRFRINRIVALSCCTPPNEHSSEESETLRKLCEALAADDSGDRWLQFRLVHARALSAAKPAQALNEYGDLLKSLEAREGQYEVKPLSDLRVYLVLPALELGRKFDVPDVATKQALAALYAAKARLLRDVPETVHGAADEAQTAAGRLAAWDRAVELDSQRQAYYVERGLARLASPAISAEVLRAVKERDLKPALEHGPSNPGIHELTLRLAVFESRSPKRLDVKIALLNEAVIAYGEAIGKLRQEPPSDLLVAGSMAHLELANYIGGNPDLVREHLKGAVDLATRATRDESRPHPETAWLALGNAQEDFGWVLWDGEEHYPLALVAFDNAVGNAGTAAAYSLFNRGRCRFKWARWQNERGANPAELILDAEGDLKGATESQVLGPVHEAECHDWLSELAKLKNNVTLAEDEAKKAAEASGEHDSLSSALKTKYAQLLLRRADECKRANRAKDQEEYLRAAEELARKVIASKPRDEIAGAVETLAYARLARGGTPDDALKQFQEHLPKDMKDAKSEHVDLLISRAWVTYYVRDGFGANRAEKMNRLMRDGADAARRLAAAAGDKPREIAARWLIAEHDGDVWKTTRRATDATKAIESWQAVLDAEPLTPANSRHWLKLAELKLAIGASANAANKAAWKSKAKELLNEVQGIDARRLNLDLKTSLYDLLALCK